MSSPPSPDADRCACLSACNGAASSCSEEPVGEESEFECLCCHNKLRRPPPAPDAGILAWDALCNGVMSEKGDWKRFRRLAGAAGKGFAIGAGLKGGPAAFAMLARMRARSSSRSATSTNKGAVVEAVKDTLRYGLFLGSFAGTYVSVDECVAAVGGDSRHGLQVGGLF